MSTLDIIRAAQRYADAEAARLSGHAPSDADPIIPDLTPFDDATQDGESILFQIEPGYGPRRFDIPMFLFLKTATAFRGFVRLNCRKPPKVLGRGKFHVRMDFPRGRGAQRLNVQVNRIVANARPGERVHENPLDFHDHRPEGLTKSPSMDTRTRADVVAAALRQYDLAPAVDPAKMAFSRAEYKALMWQLLTLADMRGADRVVRDAAATTPWGLAGLVG